MLAYDAPPIRYVFGNSKNRIAHRRGNLIGSPIRSVYIWQCVERPPWRFRNSLDQNFFDIWQYYGFPPVSSIIAGTTSADGFAHWTAGCHGSLGFYTAVLKTVNIPVRPVWVCGHELAFFPTENLYMDHGDDPYNLNVKNSMKPMTDFLIDEAMYKAWFTNDLTVKHRR
jgi:hypothetical protein